MTEKTPSTMTDTEFAQAMRQRGWRVAPPKPTFPTKPRDRVRDMTNEEFNAAVRNRAWRDQ
jgi:hypothetical protein